ncbi:GNAT family N-acetyltransferase [Legionella hackeliae]|uniref:N-acetyltransferase domain-containing protein n=1 Tax=Legionella hackeliae TaxID=449 RepID=A0A0A8URW2_LEGHA|nr:GNAT family N-acetyltransferase [Legionella hackeliae]KTD08823.1 TDP-fucosamine acetyltransferase [Legionella hackeliae]CEK10251.1 protein of unknown function [Legionella hackeliae]STX46980.1 TDP-fucosamine acetyltransferase [Legionella hackeliae]
MMNKFLSEIDTNRFGFNVAKVNNWDLPPQELLKQLRTENVKLVITRLATEDVELINELEGLGFQLKDTQLTYRFDLNRMASTSLELPSNLKLREAQELDLPQIGRLASDSFSQYGHYANNQKLDEEKVNQIYEDWAVNSFNNPDFADRFIVAVSGHEVAGFLSYKIVSQAEKKFAKGGIGAVSSNFRNQGIFKFLTKEGLFWGRELNLDWIEHNALTTNYSVGRVFTSLGFYNSASYVTLHCWLD